MQKLIKKFKFVMLNLFQHLIGYKTLNTLSPALSRGEGEQLKLICYQVQGGNSRGNFILDRQGVLRSLIFFFLFLTCSLSCFAEEFEFAQIGSVNYTQGADLDKYLYFLKLQLNKNKPAFAVFLGNNVKKSSEDNVIKLMQNLYRIKVPYYLVLGSSDTNRINGLEKKEYLDIVSAFNKKQRRKKSYYYFKPDKHFICIVLDDTSNFAPSKHGQVSDEQLDWLNKLLDKNKKKIFIIFQNTPLSAPDSSYKMSMLNTGKYSEILKNHSNILMISSSKYGREYIIKDEETGIYHIGAPDFSIAPHSYQTVKIIYDKKNLKQPDDVTIEVRNEKV